MTQSEIVAAKARFAALDRYQDRIARLSIKIGKSQVRVPGFIVGLSGTDSILAFLMAYRAAEEHGIQRRVLGVHYTNYNKRKPTWFETEIIPWLQTLCPDAEFLVTTPLGGNQDQQRWADLHLRALNQVMLNDDGFPLLSALDDDEKYWVVGTINATEHMLGQYSVLATAASVQPLRTLFKSDILDICTALDVPKSAIERSQIPDCLCGRDELAAQNIRVIDEILTHRVIISDHDPALLTKLFQYIADLKKTNGFKDRIPYVI